MFRLEDLLREATGKGPKDPIWEPPPEPERRVWRTQTIVLVLAALAAVLIVGLWLAGTAHGQAVSNIAPGTTVSTTGPVTSSTTIETGTIAGQLLLYVTSLFVTSLGSLASAWLYRAVKSAGIDMTDKFRARLQEIVVNSLNAGAAIVAANMAGKGSVTVKQPIIAEAVKYVQAHAADTLKALGVDPASEEAVSAIKARIETAIADPTVPTPPALTPGPPAISPVIGPKVTTGVPSSLTKGLTP